jgi:hypothetical protein
MANCVKILQTSEFISENDYFLLLSSEECRQCDLFYRSLTLIEQNNELPKNVYVMTFNNLNVADGVMRFAIDQLPTFLQFSDGEEVRRWIGFFDQEIDTATDLLLNVMQSSLDEMI